MNAIGHLRPEVVNSFTLGGKVFALFAGDSEDLPAVGSVFQVRGASTAWAVVAYADIQADSGDAGRWAEVRIASGMPARTVARGEIVK
jgi:hypothetical protein